MPSGLRCKVSACENRNSGLFLSNAADERHLGTAIGAGALGDNAAVLGDAFLRVYHFLLFLALNAICNNCHRNLFSLFIVL